jgi:hypothetical protein
VILDPIAPPNANADLGVPMNFVLLPSQVLVVILTGWLIGSRSDNTDWWQTVVSV